MKKPIPPEKSELMVCPKEFFEIEIYTEIPCPLSLKELLNEIRAKYTSNNDINEIEENLASNIFIEPILKADENGGEYPSARIVHKLKDENYKSERELYINSIKKYNIKQHKYEKDLAKYNEWLEELADKERNKND